MEERLQSTRNNQSFFSLLAPDLHDFFREHVDLEGKRSEEASTASQKEQQSAREQQWMRVPSP